MWNISFGNNNGSGKGAEQNQVIEEIYTQFATDSDHFNDKPVLPTVLGEAGSLLYKFFDINMFVVSTSNAADPSDMTFFVVNAVSGHIVY